MKRVLLLQAFREDAERVQDTTILLAAVEEWAHLVILGEARDNRRIRTLLRPPADYLAESAIFIDSSATTWRQDVIREILVADAIVIRFTPKTSDFPPFNVANTPVYSLLEYYNVAPVDPRTGAGLLTELAYCARLDVLSRCVALLDESHLSLIYRFVRSAQASWGGEAFVSAGKALMPLLPRLTALDKQIQLLDEVTAVFALPSDPLNQDVGFVFALRDILQRLAEPRRTSLDLSARVAQGYLDIGTSDTPKLVFPDYELKRIRYTPVEHLLFTSPGNLMEISHAEASAIVDQVLQLSCPYCGAVAQSLFLFVYGLQVEHEPAIRCKCQRCGRKSSLINGSLYDM